MHYLAEKPDNSCFPSMATIKLENGKIITMSELQKGDKVQIGNRKDNSINFTFFLMTT